MNNKIKDLKAKNCHLADVLKRSDAHLVLNTDGSVKTSGNHIDKSPYYEIPNADGTIKRVYLNTVKAGASPTASIVSPDLPSDIGTTQDLSKNKVIIAPGDLNDVNQGQVSDCYALSAYGCLLENAFWYISQLFSYTISDGKFGFTYRRNPTSPVTVKVDGKLNTYYAKPNSLTGAIGCCIFEKTYAFFRTGSNTYASLNWGDPGMVFKDLGCTVSYLSANASGLTSILAMIAQKKPMAFCTAANIIGGAPLIPSHCYMFVDADSTGLTFTVANPWNFDGIGNDGVDDGIVKITWAQLMANCTLIAVVTGYSSDIDPKGVAPILSNPNITPVITVPVPVGPITTLPIKLGADKATNLVNCKYENKTWLTYPNGFVGDIGFAQIGSTFDLPAVSLQSGKYRFTMYVGIAQDKQKDGYNWAEYTISIGGTPILFNSMRAVISTGWDDYVTLSSISNLTNPVNGVVTITSISQECNICGITIEQV